MYIRFQVKYPLLLLSYFNETWIFSTNFRVILISNFMKLCSVGAELFLSGRQTDVTQLIVAFRSFTNAPKKMIGFHYVRLSGEGEKIESETKHDRRKWVLFHQRLERWNGITICNEWRRKYCQLKTYIYLGKSVMGDGRLENANGEKILLWKRKATTTRKIRKNYNLV